MQCLEQVCKDRAPWFACDMSSAIIEVQVGTKHLGPMLLPRNEPVTFGRDPRCGLRIDEPRLSSVLASFAPTEHGWIVTNGKRTRMTLSSPFVVDAVFAPAAQVLLQRADWNLAWDLDVLVQMSLRYRDEPPAIKTARDRPSRVEVGAPSPGIGTLVAGDVISLNTLQRQRLAALFAYLINDEPKPDNVAAAGSALIGDSPDRLMKVAGRIRDYINERRDEPIESLEDLGYHLVKVAGAIGPDDLPSVAGGLGPHHGALSRPMLGPIN